MVAMNLSEAPILKGQLDVPLTYVYLWYLLCSLGILGDNLPIHTHVIIGLSNRDFPIFRGTVGIGVHPTIS